MSLINQAGLDLIKRFEGFRSEAYRCPAGVLTIGYGHTEGVQPGDTVSLDRAELLLRRDLQWAADAVDDCIDVPLTANQRAALISFTFNVGAGALKRSTLRKRLNAGECDAVPQELARWNRGGGTVLRGLVRRRAAEAELWQTPDAPERGWDGAPVDQDMMAQAVTPEAPRPLRKTSTGKTGAAGIAATASAGLAAAAENADSVLGAVTNPAVRAAVEYLPWAAGALSVIAVAAVVLLMVRKHKAEREG